MSLANQLAVLRTTKLAISPKTEPKIFNERTFIQSSLVLRTTAIEGKKAPPMMLKTMASTVEIVAMATILSVVGVMPAALAKKYSAKASIKGIHMVSHLMLGR